VAFKGGSVCTPAMDGKLFLTTLLMDRS